MHMNVLSLFFYRAELSKFGKKGVHTTVVCPYFISTGMFDGAKGRSVNILYDFVPLFFPHFLTFLSFNIKKELS